MKPDTDVHGVVTLGGKIVGRVFFARTDPEWPWRYGTEDGRDYGRARTREDGAERIMEWINLPREVE